MDRGKQGSEMHVLSDANGLRLLVGVTAANTHDSLALKPMIMGHQTRHDPRRGRHFKLRSLHADKANNVPTCENGYTADGSGSASPAREPSRPNGSDDAGG